uniref:Uncharacterized protein MANES_08G016600 n=1 Tax=Rhizophora mucronata TaxID=61149 RepID=A0A2P2MRG9_RHIMU
MLVDRNCLWDINLALGYYVIVAIRRSAPQHLKLMQAGLLVKNPMHTFIHLMVCHSMNWQYLFQKAASILLRTMMTYASSVLMVEILFFVMDAQGPFIKFLGL